MLRKLFLLILLVSPLLYAHESMGFLIRDTLIVKAGKIIVGNGLAATSYFLDINNDTTPDFYLDFGPDWFIPDDSTLVIPNPQDSVKLEGVVDTKIIDGVPRFVVCYINDKTWRIPYSAKWNNLGNHVHSPSHHENTCIPTCFGFNAAALQPSDISGTIVIDSTLGSNLYYLDTNADDIPDYFLNFGPPWYKPASGAVLPQSGQVVNIQAGVIFNRFPYPMAVVYSINGVDWFGNNFNPLEGGGWLQRNIAGPVQFHSLFYTMDIITVNPNWHPGAADIQDVPDSVFVQILERDPEGIPERKGQRIFAAYETALFYPDSESAMFHHGFCGGHIHLVTDMTFQYHYTDEQLKKYNVDENTIKARFFYDHSMQWETFPNAIINTEDNTITVKKNTVLNFVILTGQKATSTDVSDNNVKVNSFSLEQNYPNPFNPATKIKYNMPYEGNIKLSLYDVLGKQVAVLIEQHQNSGSFLFDFDAKDYGISSGIFFYKLEVNNPGNVKANYVAVKKLILLK